MEELLSRILICPIESSVEFFSKYLESCTKQTIETIPPENITANIDPTQKLIIKAEMPKSVLDKLIDSHSLDYQLYINSIKEVNTDGMKI